MSPPGGADGETNDSLPESTNEKPEWEQVQAAEEGPVASASWRRLSSDSNTSTSLQSLFPRKKSKAGEESDEDLFTVPEVEAPPPMNSAVVTNAFSDRNNENNAEIQHQTMVSGKRRRGRNPIDKEYRRLKRLLRNRVSAQQARERKKVYVNDLEWRAKKLQDMNSKLEEKISTLTNENSMLRKVLLNTRPKNDESIEPKQDQFNQT